MKAPPLPKEWEGPEPPTPPKHTPCRTSCQTTINNKQPELIPMVHVVMGECTALSVPEAFGRNAGRRG